MARSNPPLTSEQLVARLTMYPMLLTYEDKKSGTVYLAGADMRAAARRIQELEEELRVLREQCIQTVWHTSSSSGERA
jgi:uncharacterized protein YigA (DUF484 family)